MDYRDRGGYDLFIATVAQERWEELKKREREREREERGISNLSMCLCESMMTFFEFQILPAVTVNKLYIVGDQLCTSPECSWCFRTQPQHAGMHSTARLLLWEPSKPA